MHILQRDIFLTPWSCFQSPHFSVNSEMISEAWVVMRGRGRWWEPGPDLQTMCYNSPVLTTDHCSVLVISPGMLQSLQCCTVSRRTPWGLAPWPCWWFYSRLLRQHGDLNVRTFTCIYVFFIKHVLVPKIHHTRIPTAKLFPKDNIKLRKQIVNVHNRLRSSVRPSASDMLRMVSCDDMWQLCDTRDALHYRPGTRRPRRWLRATRTSVGASHTIQRKADTPGGWVTIKMIIITSQIIFMSEGLDHVERTYLFRLTRSPGHSQSNHGSLRRTSSATVQVGII